MLFRSSTPSNGSISAGTGLVALEGTWNNSAPVEKNGLEKLQIVAEGSRYSVHAWGQCQPEDCDWGVQPAAFDSQKATAVWTLTQPSEKKQRAIVDQETRVASVTMVPDSSGLHVIVQNTYSSQKPTEREFDFVKGAVKAQ